MPFDPSEFLADTPYHYALSYDQRYVLESNMSMADAKVGPILRDITTGKGRVSKIGIQIKSASSVLMERFETPRSAHSPLVAILGLKVRGE